MAIFISYSHEDKDFVDRLAVDMVKNRSSVWIDRWELNVGDSIIERVQTALLASSAILIVLSKASVESEWCKKELSAGLIRELDEKRVLVLPVLIDDCNIPLFLRDKLYADFRVDYETGLRAVLDSTAAVSSAEQSRLQDKEQTLDWAEDWWFNEKDLLVVRFTIVDTPRELPLTILTEIVVEANKEATQRYRQFEAAGLDWAGRHAIAELLFDIGDTKELHLPLDTHFPQSLELGAGDQNPTGRGYSIVVTSRRLGQDTGKIQVVKVSNYLRAIREYLKETQRRPTSNELKAILRIIATS